MCIRDRLDDVNVTVADYINSDIVTATFGYTYLAGNDDDLSFSDGEALDIVVPFLTEQGVFDNGVLFTISNGVPQLLDIGAARDVLTVNSDGNRLVWTAPVVTKFYGLRADNWQYLNETDATQNPGEVTVSNAHLRAMVIPLNPNPDTQYSFLLKKNGTPTGDIRLAIYLINSAGNWGLDNSAEYAARGLGTGFDALSTGIKLSSSHSGDVLSGWALITVQSENSNEMTILRIAEHDDFPAGTSGATVERAYGTAAGETIGNTTNTDWRYPIVHRF